MKSLVICPLKIELSHLLEALEKKGFEFTSVDTKLGSILTSKSTYFAVGGMGSAKFSEKLKRLFKVFPEITNILCVGSAGALRADLKVGDLIISPQSSKYQAHLTKLNLKTKIHQGEVLCLEQPLLNEVEKNRLLQSTTALAVSMEAHPDLSVLGERSFLEIRAVSDYANEVAQADFNQNLGVAMKAAAELVSELLS